MLPLRLLLRSFRHKNYRLFYFGQTVSLIGTWLQSTVQGWLVYSLTKSPAALGAVGFAGQLPMLAFPLFTGVVADRVDKRKALLITQSAALLQALVMGVLTLGGYIQPWHVFVLSCALGIINSFDMPIRQAFVVEMVGAEDLPNALALNSMMFNAARIIGPALAGFLIAYISEGPCFLVNAASYCVVLAALAGIQVASAARIKTRESVAASLRASVLYAWREPRIRYPLELLASVSLVVMPMITLMPAAAAELLGQGPQALGFLISSVGAGALAGGALLAARRSRAGIERSMAFAAFLYGASVAAFAFSGALWAACLAVACAGLAMAFQSVGANTIIQSVVSNNMRGRIMSLYAVTFVGLAPFGSLLFGWLARQAGIKMTILAAAGWAFITAFWFLGRLPMLRARQAEYCLPPEEAGI